MFVRLGELPLLINKIRILTIDAFVLVDFLVSGVEMRLQITRRRGYSSVLIAENRINTNMMYL